MKFRIHILLIVNILISSLAIGQIDSLEKNTNYVWILNKYDLSYKLVEIDTSLKSFQNYTPLLKKTITANYIGNAGGASQSNIYFDRLKFKTGFIFSEPYGIYFHSYTKQKYYNTKKQFTILNYSNTGPRNESEQLLSVLHTQNVNENFNIGIDYDLISSEGRYQNQQIRENLVSLFSSYNNKKYHLHTNANLNRVKAQENGGIDSLHYLGQDEYKNRRNIPVKLSDAKNQVFNTSFYLTQQYYFGKKESVSNKKNKSPNKTNIINEIDTVIYKNDSLKLGGDSVLSNNEVLGTIHDTLKIHEKELVSQSDNSEDVFKNLQFSGLSISHRLIYSNDVRKFVDSKIDTANERSFYNNRDIFIDSSRTSDEVRQRIFGNKISLNYRFRDKFSTSLSFYNEQVKYTYNIRPDTTYFGMFPYPYEDTTIIKNKTNNYSNNNVSYYLNAYIFNKILLTGYAEYFLSGYKKKNTFVDLNLSYKLWKALELNLEGNYKDNRPDFFYENYSSNHFKWQNDTLKRNKEWNIGVSVISNTKYKLKALFKYGQLTNYTYLDTNAYVRQHNQINIISGEIVAKLNLGPVHFDTRFVYQKSTNDSILSFPELNLYQSLYFERLSRFESTGGELLWQVGFDYRFSSSYFADGYMPVSGLFYRQFNHKLEDYHCLDFFINFKIKRARFYLKYNYINSLLTEKYYFTGPFYPAAPPAFKFGLSWTFYD